MTCDHCGEFNSCLQSLAYPDGKLGLLDEMVCQRCWHAAICIYCKRNRRDDRRACCAECSRHELGLPRVDRARAERWRRARKTFGNEWQGTHPLLELFEELLDAANYALVARDTLYGDLMAMAQIVAAKIELRLDKNELDLTEVPDSKAMHRAELG